MATVGLVIDGTWKVTERLGVGGFGKVYRGHHIRTGKPVAIKVAIGESGERQLEIEHNVYEGLRNTSSRIVGVPRLYFFGKSKDRSVLVMDLLGRSLQERLDDNGGKLSIKSVLMIGIQLLRRLQLVHHKGFIHRDVKPENLLTGIEDKDRVYLVDFGITKIYRDYETKKHVAFAYTNEIVGSVPFISINAHWGAEQSRRDDLQSLGYCLVHLFKGKLPWQEVRVFLLPWQRVENFSQLWLYNKIRNKKILTVPHKLCGGMPPQMTEYFRYVRKLKYGQRPDYAYLRGLFRKALEQIGQHEDRIFDWMGTKQKRR